jgi:hypothetical protein
VLVPVKLRQFVTNLVQGSIVVLFAMAFHLVTLHREEFHFNRKGFHRSTDDRKEIKRLLCGNQGAFSSCFRHCLFSIETEADLAVRNLVQSDNPSNKSKEAQDAAKLTAIWRLNRGMSMDSIDRKNPFMRFARTFNEDGQGAPAIFVGSLANT